MVAYLTLLPCAVAAFAVIVLRQTVLTASILSLSAALALWVFGIFSSSQPDQLFRAVADAIVLFLLVGFVIFSGIMFVEATTRNGGLTALIRIIQSLRLAPSRAIILITAGIGITMESLTGYGVSMFVTIPLLVRVVGRNAAIFLALIGMSLMAWGALSVSALLGAELAGLPQTDLSAAILTTSGPVAATIPALCLLAVQDRNFFDVSYGLLAGFVLLAGIALTSHFVGVEVAGVGGGLAVICLSLIFASSKRFAITMVRSPQILPYGFLAIGVVLQKLFVPHLSAVGIDFAIATDRVSFDILASPGAALLMAVLVSIMMRRANAEAPEYPSLWLDAVMRCWPALTSIFFFLLVARLLVEIGSVDALAGQLAQLGPFAAAALVATLGGVGSYITGSGTASNALFMPSAAATGQDLDFLPLFSALQHSGAAHVAVASLPIIAILLAALPDRKPNDASTATRMALGLAFVWLLFVISSGTFQIAMAL
ncbi:MAG: L-lactate permease [Hyphomicrobiaceae bacterium]